MKEIYMKLLFLFLSAVLFFSFAKSQTATNNLNPTGNAGVGITNPIYKLQVVSSSSNSTVIGATGLDYNFNADRYYGAVNFQPAIGFPEIGAGLVNYNDGNLQTIGCTMNNKLLWNGYADANYKIFRLNGLENNFGNFTLEFRNTGNYNLTGRNWIEQPNSTMIFAWNHPLNIGSHSPFPLRLFSDNNDLAHIADIFIQYSRVGIGTESPNANAKLDVNGNIFSNGKIVIGTTDMLKVGENSLVVNGSAIFTKAKVALYESPAWPDYVFSPTYKMPSLDSLEQFIQLNKHLPEIPTASDVEKDGIDLGNNQALLLKKIEELTLFTIEQNKQSAKMQNIIDDQGKKIDEQLQKINELEKDLIKLKEKSVQKM